MENNTFKKQVGAFIKSLFTRKFALTLAAFLTFIANGQTYEALGVVLAYLGVEGAADFKTRTATPETVFVPLEEVTVPTATTLETVPPITNTMEL